MDVLMLDLNTRFLLVRIAVSQHLDEYVHTCIGLSIALSDPATRPRVVALSKGVHTLNV